jgi:hypothetical protein
MLRRTAAIRSKGMGKKPYNGDRADELLDE